MTEQELREKIARKLARIGRAIIIESDREWNVLYESTRKEYLRQAEEVIDTLKQADYVRLAEDQRLPEIPVKPLAPNDRTKTIQVEVADWWDEEALLSYIAHLTQQIMLKANFRKVEL